jgi:hypothetical protein
VDRNKLFDEKNVDKNLMTLPLEAVQDKRKRKEKLELKRKKIGVKTC